MVPQNLGVVHRFSRCCHEQSHSIQTIDKRYWYRFARLVDLYLHMNIAVTFK